MTKGWAKFMYENAEHIVSAGDCVHQRPGIQHYLFDYSPDMEYLEVVGPADFGTIDLETGLGPGAGGASPGRRCDIDGSGSNWRTDRRLQHHTSTLRAVAGSSPAMTEWRDQGRNG